MKITKNQTKAIGEIWDSLIPLSPEVLAQFFSYTDKGTPVDMAQIPSYDWHVLDDLLACFRSRPWMDQLWAADFKAGLLFPSDFHHSNIHMQRRMLKVHHKTIGYIPTHIKDDPVFQKALI